MMITVYCNVVQFTELLFLTKDIRGTCCLYSEIRLNLFCPNIHLILSFIINTTFLITKNVKLKNKTLNYNENYMLVNVIYLNELYLFRCQSKNQ